MQTLRSLPDKRQSPVPITAAAFVLLVSAIPSIRVSVSLTALLYFCGLRLK